MNQDSVPGNFSSNLVARRFLLRYLFVWQSLRERSDTLLGARTHLNLDGFVPSETGAIILVTLVRAKGEEERKTKRCEGYRRTLPGIGFPKSGNPRESRRIAYVQVLWKLVISEVDKKKLIEFYTVERAQSMCHLATVLWKKRVRYRYMMGN